MKRPASRAGAFGFSVRFKQKQLRNIARTAFHPLHDKVAGRSPYQSMALQAEPITCHMIPPLVTSHQRVQHVIVATNEEDPIQVAAVWLQQADTIDSFEPVLLKPHQTFYKLAKVFDAHLLASRY